MPVGANQRYVVRLGLVALLYVATAKGGLALATYTTNVTAIWAPTGIALAAIVLWGRRMWPAVALGALLANIGTGAPALAIAGITAGNTLEALAGAWMLARAGFVPTLSRLRDVIQLGVLAGVLSTVVSATIGVTSLLLGGALATAEAGRVWLIWWLGDMGGDLLVAPLLFVLATHERHRWLGGRGGFETGALMVAAVVTSVFAFSASSGLMFLTFPVFLWAALRFQQAGAAVASLIVAGVAITLTAHGVGPFQRPAPDDGLLLAQLFAGVACMSALVLAVTTSERERALAEVRRSHDELEHRVRERTAALTGTHARMAATHELAPIGTWEWDMVHDVVTWSAEMYAIVRVSRTGHEPSYASYLECLHPDDRDQVSTTITRAATDGLPFTSEARIVRPDGAIRTVASGGQVLTDDDGRPVRMLGICQDVTDSRRAEGSLRESQERARLIVDAASHAFISIDEHDVITDWNPAAELLLGYSRAEALGRTLAETVIDEPQRASHLKALDRVVRTGESTLPSRRRQFDALHRDGHRITVELEVSAIKTQSGYTFNAFLQDVSDRVRAQRRLATENAVGRTLLECSSLAAARPLVLREICEGLGWAYGGWWVADRPAGALFREAMWCSPLIAPAVLERWGVRAACAVGTGLPGRAWQTGETVFISDLDGDPGSAPAPAPPVAGACCAIGLPIVCRDEVVAVLELVTTQPLALGTDICAAMTQLAERLGRFVERERLEEQLQHLADHDPLTDLFNHRRFREELARELAAAQRYGTSGVVMALDLDNLKHVNDTLGHDAGNELIACVARLVGERLRRTDTFARIGGDEFAVLLPRADEAQARQIAEELLHAVREQAVVKRAGSACGTSVSIGIAAFDHCAEGSGDELMIKADTAMYAAKEAGRDRLKVYDTDSAPLQRRSCAEQIRDALANEQFTLHAQPIVALDGEHPLRHELLVRMVGAGGDLIAPAMFMSVAERSDLVLQLDRWVVRHAIMLLALCQRAGGADCFNVNLSARSITDPDLLALIERELALTGADPTRLTFEVTETAAIVDVEGAREFARALGKIGCGVSLDDFGTGFGSFCNLRNLPFDELKIDREFVENLPTSAVNQLVVLSMAQIAHGLGKRTVAEYVGDDETIELLRSYGVDYVQGFHVGRPKPVEELQFAV